MPLTRRAFLTACTAAATGLSVPSWVQAGQPDAPLDALVWRHFGDHLRRRFGELRRHFVFDYYPWYAADPFRHWTQWDRTPPVDLAANSVPALGAYDSRSRQVVEQHARWIADSGVGVINLSWWGQGSFSDRAVPLVMDVMADHDIHVTFHLEPYSLDRAARLPEDVLYLLREYGERRRWDCFFFNEWADGSHAPLFKLFSTTLPATVEDCRGQTQPVRGFVPDTEWRRHTERLRTLVREDFDRVTLLSDSRDSERLALAGMDGMSVYDPIETPDRWLGYALTAARFGLVCSFPVNPGLDEIERRVVAPDSCYAPRPFLPAGEPLVWSRRDDREAAAARADQRTEDTLQSNLLLQTHPWLGNVDLGFFLVHITSFNEWHEGHQYEPMKDSAQLSDAERALEYHNPQDGAYRLRHLTDLLGRL